MMTRVGLGLIWLLHWLPLSLLAPLGRARLYAGDPMQLAPVLRSTWREAKVWLGRSPFAAQPSLGMRADAAPHPAAGAGDGGGDVERLIAKDPPVGSLVITTGNNAWASRFGCW